METLILRISEKSDAKKIAELVKLISGVSDVSIVPDKNVLNKETIKAISDVESGKVYKAKNANDLIRKLSK